MLHIILLILKIIGIILAAILGIAVLLLLLLLFVPLRYKVTASFPGTLKDAKAKLSATLLLHLISCYASYEDGQLHWRVRAAWKKWDDKAMEMEDLEPDHQEPDEEAKEQEKVELPKIEAEAIESEKKEPEEIPISESEKEMKDSLVLVKEKPPRKKKRKRKWRAFLRAGKKLYQKLVSLIERIKCTFRTFYAKIRVLLKKKEVLEKFIENATHKEAFQKAKKETFRVLKFVKPKKFKAQIVFGFDDPYMTGKALAFLSVLYPFIGGCTSITPDFEQEILTGELYIKGNLRVLYFVIPLVRLLFDKNVRRTYKHIKNLKL